MVLPLCPAMFELAVEAPALARAVLERSALLADVLLKVDVADLEGPSLLPDWSRLTIACHLRYGASATMRMTKDTLRGLPTSFYPDGRSLQRPGTLVPRIGELPGDVLASLAGESFWLDQAWRDLSQSDWSTAVVEPADNVDLGPTTLAFLALLRLTEVEVHGTDLDVGLPDWSEVFVATALPARLWWLETRRSDHRGDDDTPPASWLLRATDGPTHLLTRDEAGVRAEPAAPSTKADATIEGTSRDLLALLLGRPPRHKLRTRGKVTVAASFNRAFPGP
ncbi:MAG: maleylpyruvate isomerase [Acidimicrobiaceae bacterium]